MKNLRSLPKNLKESGIHLPKMVAIIMKSKKMKRRQKRNHGKGRLHSLRMKMVYQSRNREGDLREQVKNRRERVNQSKNLRLK
jgi:hypothetical protein